MNLLQLSDLIARLLGSSLFLKVLAVSFLERHVCTMVLKFNVFSNRFARECFNSKQSLHRSVFLFSSFDLEAVFICDGVQVFISKSSTCRIRSLILTFPSSRWPLFSLRLKASLSSWSEINS